MKRRSMLALAGSAAVVRSASAQTVRRIGFLIVGDPEPTWSLFKKGLEKAGYVEGRNIRIEYKAADAAGEKLDAYAADLVRQKVDVIVAVLSPSITAAMKATSQIPIVFSGGGPEIGAVVNVARPERNLTGVFSASTTVAGKAMQLFYDAKPAIRRFGIVLNAADPFHVPLRRDVEAVAEAEKIELVPVLLSGRGELEGGIAALASRGVAGAMIQPSLGMDTGAAVALRHNLPAISFRREFAEKGGLMSYGAEGAEIYQLVANQVDRVLKGTPPGNIPVEQTSRFELVVNQRTARALGFVFSPVFLARVDEVIE